MATLFSTDAETGDTSDFDNVGVDHVLNQVIVSPGLAHGGTYRYDFVFGGLGNAIYPDKTWGDGDTAYCQYWIMFPPSTYPYCDNAVLQWSDIGWLSGAIANTIVYVRYESDQNGVSIKELHYYDNVDADQSIAVGQSVTLGTWHLVEFGADIANGTILLQYDGATLVNVGPGTINLTSNQVGKVYVGQVDGEVNPTSTHYFSMDDIRVDDAPIGGLGGSSLKRRRAYRTRYVTTAKRRYYGNS